MIALRRLACFAVITAALARGALRALLVGVLLSGCACHPILPPVVGCHAGEQRCSPSGWPEVCSASARWEPAGDVACACIVTDAGVAVCVRDGGL